MLGRDVSTPDHVEAPHRVNPLAAFVMQSVLLALKFEFETFTHILGVSV